MMETKPHQVAWKYEDIQKVEAEVKMISQLTAAQKKDERNQLKGQTILYMKDVHWLIEASDNFRQAYLEDNIDQCNAVIEDIRKAGYEKEAVVLEKELSDKENEERYE